MLGPFDYELSFIKRRFDTFFAAGYVFKWPNGGLRLSSNLSMAMDQIWAVTEAGHYAAFVEDDELRIIDVDRSQTLPIDAEPRESFAVGDELGGKNIIAVVGVRFRQIPPASAEDFAPDEYDLASRMAKLDRILRIEASRKATNESYRDAREREREPEFEREPESSGRRAFLGSRSSRTGATIFDTGSELNLREVLASSRGDLLLRTSGLVVYRFKPRVAGEDFYRADVLMRDGHVLATIAVALADEVVRVGEQTLLGLTNRTTQAVEPESVVVLDHPDLVMTGREALSTDVERDFPMNLLDLSQQRERARERGMGYGRGD